jgi:signal transduction histidine kinase
MREIHGLSVEIVEHGTLHVAEATRTLLVQIARELLFNVAKHGETDRATLELSAEDGFVVIDVSDGGRGFAVDGMETGREGQGFGLFSIRERLRLLGGRMDVVSAPGEGTKVTVRAPVGLATAGPSDR